MEVLWNHLRRSEWDSIADRTEAGLQQRWSYGAAVKAHGGTVLRAAICDDGRTVAIAQVLTRRFGALVSRGPLMITPESQSGVVRALRRSLRKKGNHFLAITPEIGDVPGLPIMTPTSLALLPTGREREAMHGKWRNRLGRAEAAGLKITRLPNSFEKVRWLVEADVAQQKVQGYRTLPPSFLQAWLATNKSDVLTLCAGTEDAPVAAMMFLLHGNTATYHIGWSNAEGRAANAHNLILWSAMKRLSAKGIRTIDLGTLDTENAPGLARFKLGSGARPHRLGTTKILL